MGVVAFQVVDNKSKSDTDWYILLSLSNLSCFCSSIISINYSHVTAVKAW